MLIETRAVTRVYQMGSNEVKALDAVSIGVTEGEFVAIQGTSGSGKSTLLNLLGGLDSPTSGEILFDSRSRVGPELRGSNHLDERRKSARVNFGLRISNCGF